MPAIHAAYLAMVIVAFLAFMITLGSVSIFIRATDRSASAKRGADHH